LQKVWNIPLALNPQKKALHGKSFSLLINAKNSTDMNIDPD